MKNLSALLFLLPAALSAQTTWQVGVGGSLIGDTLPYYNPQFLTIQEGDIVHWHSYSGKHNVYAQLDVFPDNPVGFDSGSPADSPWDYSHTFTVPGVYDYHCVQNDHAITQFGTITVIGANGLLPERTTTAFSLFPVPAENLLMVSLQGCTGATSVNVIASDGRTLRQQPVEDNRLNTVDLTGLPPGQYYLIVQRDMRKPVIKAFVKM